MSTVRKGRYALRHKERNSIQGGCAQAYTESREHRVRRPIYFFMDVEVQPVYARRRRR